MKQGLIAAALALTALGAHAAGSVLVSNPGPLSSGGFLTSVFNGSSASIDVILFDLSTTATPLAFGGLNSADTSALGGGTAHVFGTPGGTLFGFAFTGFGPGESFRFSWDPDTPGNANYGAVVSELSATSVEAIVSFSTGTVRYAGVLGIVGPDVAGTLGPLEMHATQAVPEAPAAALMLAGLAGLGLAARRRLAAQTTAEA